MDAIERAAFALWAYQTSDYLPKSLHRTIDGWREWDEADKEKWRAMARVAIAAPFENADAEDWRRLDAMIDHSGTGRFWRAVLSEIPRR